MKKFFEITLTSILVFCLISALGCKKKSDDEDEPTSTETNTSTTPVPGTTGPSYADPVEPKICDSCLSYVYTAKYDGDKIYGYVQDKTTGALTAVPGSPFSTSEGTRNISSDSEGRWLFASHYSANKISAYIIDGATGALTPVEGSPFDQPHLSFPWATAVHPNGNFLYAIGGLTGQNITGYSINEGVLTQLSDSPFSASDIPFNIAFSAKGDMVYTTDMMHDNLSRFTVNSDTGTLTRLPQTPGDTISPNMVSMAVRPTGKYVYVMDINWIYRCTLEAGGTFKEQTATSAFPGGNSLKGIAIEPYGVHLYVVDYSYRYIAYFSINDSLGDLTQIDAPLTEYGTSPVGIMIDGIGHFIYVAFSNGKVTTYERDSTTGAVTAVSGSTFLVEEGIRTLILVQVPTN